VTPPEATERQHAFDEFLFKRKADIGQTALLSVVLQFVEACDFALSNLLPRHRLALRVNCRRWRIDGATVRSVIQAEKAM
jgi:hypothetical protein